MKTKHGHKAEIKDISEFYANTAAPPLLAGFKRTHNSPHAGLGNMHPIRDRDSVWEEMSQKPDPASKRSLYIHTPYCLARCKFCSFYHSRTNAEALESYSENLLKELSMMAKSSYVQSHPFNAVYFGGGTPTDHSPESFRKLLTHIRDHWNLANDCEITIEGRLYGFNNEKIETCLELGVNRFSFGIQSFNTHIRRQMGRIMERDDILTKLSAITSLNKACVSIDLIYGMPDQSHEIWMDDLLTAAHCGADSASIYRLKLLPGSTIIKQIEEGVLLPAADRKLQAELFTMSNDFFRSINARRAGVTHWAFTHRDRCVYNSLGAYGGSCLPAGCGAGGNMGHYRIMQQMSPEEYSAQVCAGKKPLGMVLKSSSDSQIGKLLFGELNLNLGVNLIELSLHVREPALNERLAPLLRQWHEAGMVLYEEDSGLLRLTDAGVFYCPQLQQNLLDYYQWSKEKNNEPGNNCN